MSADSPSEPGSETTGKRADPRRASRLQTGLRGLIVVVACCAVILWSARRVWETRHPAVDAARRLQSHDPSERAGGLAS